jgi:hypothetical protein
MRTVVLTALGLLMTAPSIPAQDQIPGWAAKLFKDQTGQIPSGHNFGTVTKGALLQHRFPIQNIYAVPLQITTQPTCNCVTATPNPVVLGPKQTGTLDITMDTTRFNGQKTVTVNVSVQHHDQQPQFWSSTSLVILAFCRGDVTLEPAQAMFGVIPVGQTANRELIVRYRGSQPWQITGVAPNQAVPVDVTYQEMSRRAGLTEYRVALALKPNTPAGSYKGEVNLATNDPNNSAVTVPYDLMVQAALSVSPDVARFPALKVGSPREVRVFVKAGRPFRILGVDGGQDSGVTAEARPEAAPTQVLTIKIDPKQPGPIQKTLTIRTDLGGGMTTTINVDAMVAAP